MQNNDFFNDDSVKIGGLATTGSTALAPLPPVSPVSSAMLLAAADPNTKMRFAKEILHDTCTAALAYSAIENILMLSAVETHCCQVAPNAAPRVKCIGDAYTVAAATRIRRF